MEKDWFKWIARKTTPLNTLLIFLRTSKFNLHAEKLTRSSIFYLFLLHFWLWPGRTSWVVYIMHASLLKTYINIEKVLRRGPPVSRGFKVDKTKKQFNKTKNNNTKQNNKYVKIIKMKLSRKQEKFELLLHSCTQHHVL